MVLTFPPVVYWSEVTVQPYSSISPLRGFSAATQLQISLMAERHMPGIKIISLFEQAQSRNYLDSRRMAELLHKMIELLLAKIAKIL